MRSDGAFSGRVRGQVRGCLRERVLPPGRRSYGSPSLPAGERDGSERAVRVRVWIRVQRAGVTGGGSPGPAHARLLPHAEPQLRAGHWEGLLPGRRVRVPAVLLPTAHHHHREDHSEQHRWVSKAPAPPPRPPVTPRQHKPGLRVQGYRNDCPKRLHVVSCCCHTVTSNKIPPMPYKERLCLPACLCPQALAASTALLSVSISGINRETSTTGPEGTAPKGGGGLCKIPTQHPSNQQTHPTSSYWPQSGSDF